MIYVIFSYSIEDDELLTYLAARTEQEAIEICTAENRINKEESVDVHYHYEEVQIAE